MGNSPKKPLFFIVLAFICLTGCGGGGSPAPESQQGDPTILFPAPGTNAPVVEADVTDLGECGAFPGEWKFLDLTTGAPMAFDVKPLSTFQDKFQKSWGGTTTAHAVWDIEPGDMEVWNEGRRLHVGSDTPLTTTGMMTSIALTGTPGAMTALIGTDRGLVIADLTRSGDHWNLKQQVTIDTVGVVRSVATTSLILEKDGPHVPMVFMVASDAVLMAKLEDLRANFGCLSVAYQAKDHPGIFHPVKIVTSQDYAAFLTAARPPEEFANADQLQLALNKEWLSFQSTAFLIDLTRQDPVAPIITTMGALEGTFDRFFASDISMSNIGVFLYGSRYNSANPAAFKSGIASYKNLQAVTPVVSLWSGVDAKLSGDYRMGRMETHITTATIRSLDRLAQAENFLSGPTQIKWTAWPDKLPLEYVRSVNYKMTADTEGKPLQVLVTAPQYLPTGPTSYVWEYKDYSKELKEGCLKIGATDKCVPDILAYTAAPPILDATPTDVSYHDVANNRAVVQHLQDEGSVLFPLFETTSDTTLTAHTPRIFHTGAHILYVRHGSNGPTVRVFQDTITGNVDISKIGPALIGFGMVETGNNTNTATFDLKKVGAFGNMGSQQNNFRVDDIREVSNPSVPNLRHFAALIHNWNGSTNNYRVLILQMDVSAPKMLNRSIEIQGCSDLEDPENNYSGNVSFGYSEERLRFLGPLTATPNVNGITSYSGFFQHSNPTYNVWSVKIDVTSEVVKPKSTCKPAGELVPLTDPAVSESLSAVLSGDTLLGLHSNGQVKWKIDATTTQFLDVGANILGAPVTLESGQLLGLAGMLFTRMDTPDGFHPVALFSQDGSFGETCPDCQFTDAFSADPLLLTSHPERGVELYDFSK